MRAVAPGELVRLHLHPGYELHLKMANPSLHCGIDEFGTRTILHTFRTFSTRNHRMQGSWKSPVALFALTVFANPAVAENGVSIGGAIGSSEIDEFCDLFGSGVSCDDTDTATKFFIGRDINENVRIEGFWLDLGEVKATDSVGDSVSVETDGFGFSVMPMAPATDRLDIFAKLGIYMWDATATANISGASGTASDDGTDTFVGFGARYQVNEQFSARAEWEEFDLDGTDVTVLSIGGEIFF